MSKRNEFVRHLNREYEHLTLANDFIFRKVMENEDLCRRLLETILHIEIDHLDYLNTQEDLKLSPDSKGIRLDVYVKGTDAVFDIEMQSVNKQNLPKRSRYYQAVIDSSILEAGVDSDYTDMPDSYVIFICLEDPFKDGLHYYLIENTYRLLNGESVPIHDGSRKVFLNAKGTAQDIDAELAAFLEYLVNGTPTDELTRDLDQAVKKGRINSEWRREYMKMSLFEYDAVHRGFEEGKEQGFKDGIEQGLQQGAVIRDVQNVKRMTDKGIAPKEIAELLGLSEEDVLEYMKMPSSEVNIPIS